MMHEAVPIVFIVIGLPIICVTLISLAKHRSRSADKRQSDGTDDEAKIIDEVFWGLKDLNRRIENLETIISKERDGRSR